MSNPIISCDASAVSPADSSKAICTLISDIRTLIKLADETGRSRLANGIALNTRDAIAMVRLQESVVNRILDLSRAEKNHEGPAAINPPAGLDEREQLIWLMGRNSKEVDIERPDAHVEPSDDPMPKRSAFVKWANKHGLDTSVEKDVWGVLIFKHHHTQAMWTGWFSAPTAAAKGESTQNLGTIQEQAEAAFEVLRNEQKYIPGMPKLNGSLPSFVSGYISASNALAGRDGYYLHNNGNVYYDDGTLKMKNPAAGQGGKP